MSIYISKLAILAMIKNIENTTIYSNYIFDMFCVECSETVIQNILNEFSFEHYNSTYYICNKCFTNIDKKLVKQIDLSQLRLLKIKIKKYQSKVY